MPEPSPHQLRLRVLACGVCRTDLHIVDGELAQPKLPLVLGHEIVGRVDAMGAEVQGFAAGDRVGVPWLGFTDGTCPYCRNHQENLCDNARFTGYQIDGGYASYTVADARYCFHLPESLQRRGSSSAALRRADRLPLVEDDRRRRAPRHLRLRRRSPYRGAGGALPGAPDLCLHPAWRCTRARLREGAWRGMGRRVRRETAGRARRRHHLRACRGAGAGGA